MLKLNLQHFADFNPRPTPLQPNSAESMIVGVGAIYVDVDTEDFTSDMTGQEIADHMRAWNIAGSNLGATTGDVTHEIGVQLENIDTNDLLVPTIGLQIISESNAQMSFSLQEVTERNIGVFFPTHYFDDAGAIRISTSVPPRQRYRNFVWLGQRGDGSYMMVELYHAINLQSSTITATDLGIGNVPVTVQGTASDFNEMDSLPARIFIFGQSAPETPVIGASLPSTNLD